jgi:hypothetical protein
LAFENHYLAIYRDYLLEQLRGDDPGRQLFAAERLRDVVYPDQELRSALNALDTAGAAARAAAQEALQVYAAAPAKPTTTQRQSI